MLSDLVAPVLTAPANITLEAEGQSTDSSWATITDTDVAAEAISLVLGCGGSAG